jgi:hypothetical protein
MCAADKYEVEVQRLLTECAGDWETLARALFYSHQGTQAARKEDNKRMMRALKGKKSSRIRGKTLDVIWMMQDKIDEYRKPGDTMKAALARMATQYNAAGELVPMRRLDRDSWEKVFAEYNGNLRALKAHHA